MMRNVRWILFCLLALALPVAAQQDLSGVEIKTTPLRGGTYMLTGAGGNIVASVGDDAVFIIDDQFAPLTDKIRAALAKLSDKPVRFVINTHWHGDHTGGNENFGKAGAVIVAHKNVRKRMSAERLLDGETIPASPDVALPVVTFTSDVSLHLNGDDVHAIHVAHAHTDGDALVKFEQANVLHTGDVYFNGLYPYIDADSGGSIGGMIAAVDRALDLSDADTIVVPGHGPVSNRVELAAYGKMLENARDRVAALKAEGKTLAEVIAAKPTAATDEKLGKAFINPVEFATAIYNTL